jgi:ABC-2 type transport system permease protein
MLSLTTVTGCVCLSLVTEDVELTYTNLILLNVGAFLVLLALSGLCFFTSCVFDRSKRSMAIGGGLSIFALVAAMLGLFGSPVIPSVVRLDALSNFNYATIISLFDVIAIIDGTNAFIWKFIILGVVGLLGYILGSIRFTKKDLPL